MLMMIKLLLQVFLNQDIYIFKKPHVKTSIVTNNLFLNA